jgi:predicted unusual protein kinase regulating ubiquinone biosynthesis (AarF/ABC1/UbiB family)
MVAQMDLLKEAENLNKFRENFKDEKEVGFPKPIDHMVTKNVLVEVSK